MVTGGLPMMSFPTMAVPTWRTRSGHADNSVEPRQFAWCSDVGTDPADINAELIGRIREEYALTG
jgi:hypothetical protein